MSEDTNYMSLLGLAIINIKLLNELPSAVTNAYLVEVDISSLPCTHNLNINNLLTILDAPFSSPFGLNQSPLLTKEVSISNHFSN